jgi:hypothetical protein
MGWASLKAIELISLGVDLLKCERAEMISNYGVDSLIKMAYS